MLYSSWIKVSDFAITVEAKDKDEAIMRIKDILEGMTVRAIEEDGIGYTELGCTITDVEPDVV